MTVNSGPGSMPEVVATETGIPRDRDCFRLVMVPAP